MSTISRIWYLFKKDAILEWRKQSTIAAMLVYVVSTVFVIYLSFKGTMEATTWMSIYWIILLFVVVNLTAASFKEEATRQFYYIRSLGRPVELIIAKMLFNSLYFIVLAGLTLAISSLFLGNPADDLSRFMLVVVLGSIGLSNLFTLLAAITSRINNMALIAVLGFPIVIPLILLSIRLSAKTLDRLMSIGFEKEILSVVLLDVLIIGLAMILFTYLWRD